ncbi:MAG: transcription termination/antitermination factor NusG [Ruminococcaceae bacterium]|nr:transcription termination/antitermination factor NusG [Oscillospiraceae bacterium]
MSDLNEGSGLPLWYVVHTYSGYENKVKANLDKIVENRGLHSVILESRVPVETVQEIKEVKKDDKKETQIKEVENKIFPSYVLVKMIMSDATWHVVRNIRGVTGFVGPGSKPVPLTDEEVAAIGVETTEMKLNFSLGDTVQINDGPLTGFIGRVEEISADKKKIMVMASMFGRETPVELESVSVSKLDV